MVTAWGRARALTIPGLLRRSAEAVPAKTALRMGSESLTYEELITRATAYAHGLRGLGIGRGDAVAALTPNSLEMLYTWLGATMLGAVYVPTNIEYRGSFLTHQWNTAGIKAALVHPGLVDAVAAVKPDLVDLAHLIVPSQTGQPAPSVPGLVTHTGSDLLAAGSDAAESDRALGEPAADDIGAVIFTAGTTGLSKGVAMSQNYLVRSAEQVFDLRGADQDSTVYAALPLFHLAAISLAVLGPLSRAATGAIDNRFSPSTFWQRTRETGADQVVLLGAMSSMLWNNPPDARDTDHPVRYAMIAPMPAELHRPFEHRFGLRVLQLYAQSEAYPLTITPAHEDAPPGSAGKANPLFTVKLFDEHDNEVSTGEVGEVVARPNEPGVMSAGYYRNPAATAAAWRNLWMHTGDLGRFDAGGYFYFVDRKKDYLRRRGENISSFEIERVLTDHPAVEFAAVVAVASELTEDDVAACLVLAEGARLDHEQLMGHCVANMPYFAVPRYLWVLDELPRNAVGRVEKYKLRERLAVAVHGQDGLWDRQQAGYRVTRQTVAQP
jgi:crotonobetaine/carnitine-CoA ligase